MDEGLERVRRIDGALSVIDERNRQATRDQSGASGDIARQVEAISQKAESNTHASQENREAARGMLALGEDLRQLVSRFRL